MSAQETKEDTLQRYNTESLKQIFPEKKLHGLSPNFHIHVSVSYLYIPGIGPNIFLQQKADQPWEYINSTQTHECGNWDTGRAFPFLGTHKWDFYCSAGR